MNTCRSVWAIYTFIFSCVYVCVCVLLSTKQEVLYNTKYQLKYYDVDIKS